MSKQALVFGCGYTGRAIVEQLSDAGYAVTGVKRAWERDPDGIRTVEADVTRPSTLEPLGDSYEVVVNCVAAGARGDIDRYRTVYKQGARNLVEWGRHRVQELFLYTGSSSVYGQAGGEWVDEESVTQPIGPAGQILLETERLYREAWSSSGFPAMILRLTGIYGPGRTRSVDHYRQGDVVIHRGGRRYRNTVHRDDIARAVRRLAARPSPGDVYNLSDCEPATDREFYHWLSRRLEASPPPVTEEPGPRKTNKRVSSRRFRTHYEFRFRYPTFREGLEPLLTG